MSKPRSSCGRRSIEHRGSPDTFLRATGSAAALSLSGRLGLAQTLPEVGALHRLLEETPHERVAAELAGLIREGLDHRRTLAALAVATSRRVQPFPHVGFKYHTVLALQSVHLTALNLADKERWLPVFWALDYFKRAQETERRQSGWTMSPQPDPVAGTLEAARTRLIDALDRWDLEAVDPAILDFARLATPEQLSELLFRYGIRDLRAIGHKAIAVQNVHRLLPIVGPEHAPPVLRSLAAALQNHGNDPNPAASDLPSDRTWREFRAMLGEIPKTWKQGRRDDAARNELVHTLREVSELDAGRAVIDLLKHGVSTDSIWEGLFATAAELVLRRPAVVPVHAQTSANAFHHAFRHARAETTQILALLQSAAFMPAFRRGIGNTRADLRIDELEPLAVPGDGTEALREAFSELPHDRTTGARKALHYLQHGGSADRFVARRAPAPGSQWPAVPRLQVHRGCPGELPGNVAHRVAEPNPVRLDGILHGVRIGAESRCARGSAVAWLGATLILENQGIMSTGNRGSAEHRIGVRPSTLRLTEK